MAQEHIFEVQGVERYGGKSQPLKRPREITCFSYDVNREWHYDDSSMQYYWPPSLPANLCAGFDTFKRWDDSIDEHLDGLLRAIMTLEQETGQRQTIDVITWRGMLTKIMSASFDRFNTFEMNATLFQGTIFIEENHSAQFVKKQEQNRRPPNRTGGPSQDMMSYWGYKFESLALIPSIWDETSRDHIESRETHIVDNIAQYCSVVQTGIGSTSVILGGEVDAVWDRKPEDKDQEINWVELKTSEEIQSDHDKVKFERKLLKFWIQSFLLGVPKIIVGFRSKNGTLLRLEEFATRSIPGTVKRQGMSWDGNTCVNFCAAFLEFLKQTITSEGVWRIRRKERSSRIEIFKVEEHGTGRILSDEFILWRQKLMATEVAKMLR